jgi:hypothetical protein
LEPDAFDQDPAEDDDNMREGQRPPSRMLKKNVRDSAYSNS